MNEELINGLAEEISSTHHLVGRNAVFEVALLCAKAKSQLDDVEAERLSSKLPFSPSYFSKYTKIGKNAALHEQGIKEHLPSSFSILYAASKLTDFQLKNAIDDGHITVHTTRDQMEKLARKKPTLFDEATTAAPERPPTVWKLHVPRNLDPEKERELEDRVAAICEDLRVSCTKPKSLETRMWKLYQRYLCKYGRAHIRARKKAMKGYWPFKHDEVSIQHIEDVRPAFAVIGSNDEYDRVHKLAWDKASDEAYKGVDDEPTTEELELMKQMVEELRAAKTSEAKMTSKGSLRPLLS